MLLIYTPKITPRLTYVFKHICIRILGLDIGFTTTIEEFIAHTGAKLSYNKQPLGNEFFIQSRDLLFQQGVESIDITVRAWEDTKCFFICGEKSMLPYDIFAASFYLISRYEEYLPHVKDELGRYPVTESLGYKASFLQQPVVDLWAFKFKKKLQEHFPDLDFTSREFKKHHLVEVQTPYLFLRKGIFRSTVCFFSDIVRFRLKTFLKRTQVVLRLKPDPYDVYDFLIEVAKKTKIPTTVFFILGENEDFFTEIETQHPKYKELIKYVGDYLTTGLLFSKKALKDVNLLKEEKKIMETITNREVKKSLNAHYFVNLPENYRNLIALEVASDCSMVYETVPGFRAGTCTPFLFYDLDYEIKTPLIINPVAFSTTSFSNKNNTEADVQINSIIQSVKKVNGTFSVLFTNLNFTETPKNKFWKKLFLTQ